MRVMWQFGIRWCNFMRNYTSRQRPTVDSLDFSCLDKIDRRSLEREFDRNEVIQVLKEVEGDKAPWPDSVTMAFYKVLKGGCEGCDDLVYKFS